MSSVDVPVHPSSPVRPIAGPGGLRRSARTAFRWHRPLMALALGSTALLVVCLVGMATDPRVLTGAPIWDKPAKFALSIAVYAATLAWLISRMPRRRRVASLLGTVSGLMLAGELVAIVLQVVRGRTSHFDFTTPLDAAIYQAMGAMVGTLWLANAVLVVLLLVSRHPDPSLGRALRAGLVIAVVGMALAVLMTLPTPAQQAGWASGGAATVVGAHTVGLADGGPGLPVLGWSTVGGDLRIPHFVGLHGLQVMVLLGLALPMLGRRIPVLARPQVRSGLIVTAAAAYLAVMGVLTWQALRGQSIVHPDVATIGTIAGIAGITAGVGGLVLLRGVRATRGRP